MLTHMRQAGKLDQIKGVVFGKVGICEKQDGVETESVLLDIFQDQEIPIICGFPSGHGQPSLTIPLGVDVTLDGNQGRLIFNESGLSIP
jgi:muramoyltetrapeptide carboxypeptidase